MKVSDFIFNFLSGKGIDTAFMVSGGQAMWLVDSLKRNNKLETICVHHEQTATMAAEAYGRIKGIPGIALVTAGPGSINAINGVVGAWVDSTPMFIISGQSNLSYVKYQEKTGIRQYGVQGINIKPIVENIVKYFVTVDDPSKIGYIMEEAYHLATTGRPGPVWIDVPIDIQRAEIPLMLSIHYEPVNSSNNALYIEEKVKDVISLIKSAKRPLLLVGQGIRLANADKEFVSLINKLNVPVVVSRMGMDLLEYDSPLYVGRPGIYGERAGNFAIQNADLVISLGCRLSTPLIGYDGKTFAKNASLIVVEIDQKELDKPGANIDVKINCDLKVFMENLLKGLKSVKLPLYSEWIDKCNSWKHKYPVVLPEYSKEKPVNSYFFTQELSALADSTDNVLLDTGSCFHVVSQAWKVKKGQRVVITGGISTMGYWVAGIGSCLAKNKNRTIVITGDGSLQMNIQEFATIKHNNLPIKVFIFNNNGYLLIRHTQRNFMEDRFHGEGENSGVWCPDALEIAKAYGIKGVRISSTDNMQKLIKEVLDFDGPVICDVMTPEWQLLQPRVSSEKKEDGTLVSRDYEDMYPFLPREEFLKEMIIKPLDE